MGVCLAAATAYVLVSIFVCIFASDMEKMWGLWVFIIFEMSCNLFWKFEFPLFQCVSLYPVFLVLFWYLFPVSVCCILLFSDCK